ncbi:MAG: hypothetical protein AB7Q97_20780 [Gammaproteobacteria bacterium]
MTEHDDVIRIEPAQVALSQAQAGTARRRGVPWAALARAAAGLLLLGLLVFAVVVLPKLVGTGVPQSTPPAGTAHVPPAPVPAAAAAGPAAATARAADADMAPEAKSAAEDPALARARAEAQDALEKIRELEPQLAARAVERWGAAERDRAARARAEGEAAYLRLDYATARDRYVESRSILEALLQRSEAVLADALARGAQALEAGDAAAAAQAFELALAIDPANEAGKRGLGRAKTLDEVRALVTAGQAYERESRWDAARAQFRRALEIDSETAAARAGLQRIDAAVNQRDFTAAMSAGFSAQDRGDLGAARAAFQRALALRPQAADAAGALAEIDRRQGGIRLAQAIADAQVLEAKEDWWAAVVRYDEALKIDDSAAAARDGATRARQRAELDVKLAQAIEHPERLQAEEVRKQAAALRDRAVQIAAPGPKLDQQIARLSLLLKQALIPVAVKFQSNEQTEVQVYRVGRFGRFQSLTRDILPGRYLAVGSREGYRDVQVEFTVGHDAPPAAVTVQCTEKLAFGAR